jgi:hypothetical protein
MISIMPFVYCDGVPTMRDSEIAMLYNLMQRDGTDKTIFWDGQVKNNRDFIRFMKSSGIVLFVAKDDSNLLGCGWLTNFEHRSARAHFCIFAEGWPRSVDIGKKLVEKAIASLELDGIIGFIPECNNKAIQFAVKCGAKVIGYLPFGSFNENGDTIGTATIFYAR